VTQAPPYKKASFFVSRSCICCLGCQKIVFSGVVLAYLLLRESDFHRGFIALSGGNLSGSPSLWASPEGVYGVENE
jgi:hypothetical protein